jgi:MGT family glycosyltransferase
VSRLLLAMWEGGGTVPPELGVARRLVERGHAVHVLADPTIRERAEALGCGFTPWHRAPHRTSLDPEADLLKDWEARSPLTMLRNARDRFMTGPAAEVAADTADAIAAIRPDAVVADWMMLGAIVAAQGKNLPVAAVMPNIWMIPTPGLPAVGPGFAPARTVLGRGRDAVMRAAATRLFDGGLPALNEARAQHGLLPLTSLFDQVLGADRVLVLTSSTFDFAAAHVPDNVRYVGPILDEPQWVEPWIDPWPTDGQPLVLVGFTSNYQAHGPLLRRVVEALSALPIRAIVTLGQILDDGEVAPAGNVAVVRSAPHGEILERAALAVTHCGHGTTLKALAAGVPLVCIPMGRDQNDTAARVVHHGAGIRLRPGASVARIRDTVRAALVDGRLRSGAERLAVAISEETRSTDPVGEIEELVGTAPAGGGTSRPAGSKEVRDERICRD